MDSIEEVQNQETMCLAANDKSITNQKVAKTQKNFTKVATICITSIIFGVFVFCVISLSNGNQQQLHFKNRGLAKTNTMLELIQTPTKPLFSDVDLTSGYVDMQNKFEDQIFYTYTKSFSGDKNAPLVISNPGGPGLIAQVMLTSGGGPMEWDFKNNTLKKSTQKSYVEFADLLIPDLPSGTGFSQTNWKKHPKILDIADMVEISIDFFVKLDALRPELKIKQKNLIFNGVSYGTPLLLEVAKGLSLKGFKVKALLQDSPYLDMKESYEEFSKIMVEGKVLGKGTAIDPNGTKLIKYGAIAKKCAASCTKTEKGYMAVELRATCNNLFDGKDLYMVGKNPNIASAYDLRNSKKDNLYYRFKNGKVSFGMVFWATALPQKVFKNDKKYEF